ncbi:hypothetical protein U1Q18_018639 [Sarracenia purpurea var. burkii]
MENASQQCMGEGLFGKDWWDVWSIIGLILALSFCWHLQTSLSRAQLVSFVFEFWSSADASLCRLFARFLLSVLVSVLFWLLQPLQTFVLVPVLQKFQLAFAPGPFRLEALVFVWYGACCVALV